MECSGHRVGTAPVARQEKMQDAAWEPGVPEFEPLLPSGSGLNHGFLSLSVSDRLSHHMVLSGCPGFTGSPSKGSTSLQGDQVPPWHSWEGQGQGTKGLLLAWLSFPIPTFFRTQHSPRGFNSL